MKKPPRLILLTLSFACLLCFVLTGVSCSTNPSAGSDPTGSYELYYTLNDQYQTVVENPGWETPHDTPLTISMTNSSGPIKCSVTVYHKEDSASEWITAGSGTVVLGDPACSFTIPENHTVRVVARAVEGRSGYATLQVSLE